MKKLISLSEKETKDLGAALARRCQGGEVFLVSGNLGVGKTRLAQGFAQGLGVKSRVNSPTFNILKIYSLKKEKIRNFYHFDAYRIGGQDDLWSSGFEEFLRDPQGVSLVEWADKIEKKIAAGKIIKIILEVKEEDKRIIKIYEPKNF